MQLHNSKVLFPQGGKRLPQSWMQLSEASKGLVIPTFAKLPRPEKRHQDSVRR